MRDARLVGLNDDGTRLVLELPGGERVTVRVDAQLRAAVRQDRSRLGQLQIETESRLRPAEIQARIRSGRTPEEVAAEAGISVERVERYAVPVLHEREHMAQAGQAAGVRREGAVELLGQLVGARLEEHGVSLEGLAWDSWRRDDGSWELTLTYAMEGKERTAQWVFDAARTVVTADDDEARWLTDDAPEPAPEASVHRLRPVRKKKAPKAPDPDEVFDREALAEAAAEVDEPAEDDAVEVDLFHVDEPVDEPVTDPEPDVVEPEAETEPAARKGRASVPSWDEILFGSRKPE